MTRTKIALISLFLLVALYIGVLFCPHYSHAGPPHPSKHYRWEALPTGEVILYYLEDGQYSRYVYRMVHEVEPAVDCTHKFKPEFFRLITFSTTMPYWYTINYKPIRKWDSQTKKYILLEE